MTEPITDHPQATARQMVAGAAWMVLFKFADKGLGVISTLLLARLLTPSDFGLVAMATAVFAFTQLMGGFGFDTALIQNRSITRAHLDTAWTFNVILGTLIGLVLLSLSWPAAEFYRDDRLVAILQTLALGAAIGGFENIGTVAFRRDLNFREEFKLLFCKRLAGVIVTVMLALTLQTYWALVLGSMSSRIISVAISYRLHPYRPEFSLSAKGELLGFSRWIFISNLIVFMQQRSTDFILGRSVGAHGLGVYNIGVEIACMPSTELIAPINRAIYPIYARISDDQAGLIARFLDVFCAICLLAIPVCAGLACLAEPALLIVLGPKWEDAIPIIKIASAIGLVGALQSNMYLVIVAMGQPRATTVLSGVLLLIFLPIIIVASLRFGILGAAWAQFASAIFSLVGVVATLVRMTDVTVRQLLSSAIRPALSAAFMSIGLLYVLSNIGSTGVHDAPLKIFLGLGFFGFVLYIAGVTLLWLFSGSPAAAVEYRVYLLVRSYIAKFRS